MDEKIFEGCYCEIADICHAMTRISSSGKLSKDDELACKAAANLLSQFRRIVMSDGLQATAMKETLRELLARNGEG